LVDHLAFHLVLHPELHLARPRQQNRHRHRLDEVRRNHLDDLRLDEVRRNHLDDLHLDDPDRLDEVRRNHLDDLHLDDLVPLVLDRLDEELLLHRRLDVDRHCRKKMDCCLCVVVAVLK
jgi:hypothetical protein